MNNVKLTYGFKDSRLYHVMSVENGLSCGCTCPKCGATLVAKNNVKKMSAHFAHYQSDECKGGVETALHKMAIQIIVENKTISTPGFFKTPSRRDRQGNVHYGNEINYSSIKVDFDEVYPEYTRDGYRVDATGLTDNKMVHIEIRVTHEVDEEKSKKVRGAGDIMFEIDLRGVDPNILMDDAEFKKVVLHDASNRKWISNPKLFNLLKIEKDKLKEEVEKINSNLQKKIDEEEKKYEQQIKQREIFDKNAEKERHKYIYELTLLSGSIQSESIVEREKLLETNLLERYSQNSKELDWSKIPGFINTKIKNDWIFNVHRYVWQSWIFHTFFETKKVGYIVKAGEVSRSVINEFGVLDYIVTLDKIKQEWKKKGRERNKYYGEYGCWFLSEGENRSIPSPFGVIMQYIDHLYKHEFLSSPDGSEYNLRLEINSIDSYYKLVIKRLEEAKKAEEKQLQQEKQRLETIQRNKEVLIQDKETRKNEVIASEMRVFELFSGEGRRCLECYFVCHESDGEKCPFCNGSSFGNVIIYEGHLSVARFKYKTSMKVRDSVLDKPEVNLDLIMKWI